MGNGPLTTKHNMSKHIILIAIYLSFAALPGAADEQTKSPDFNENGTVDISLLNHPGGLMPKRILTNIAVGKMECS